jgi:hypothetical protein
MSDQGLQKDSSGTNINNTSDVNFAAYLAYQGEEMLGTSVTKDNGRSRVWFNFYVEADNFKKHKDDYFGHKQESEVIAHKYLQERERIYSLMIQIRNSSNGDS